MGIYPKEFLNQKDSWDENAKLVFVLMPFSEVDKEIYEDVIKPSMNELGLNCLRADEIFGFKAIMEDILRYIATAKIIIADVTGRNPNVFYELGISHTIKDNVVIITQTLDDVPFDLRHIRCIVYTHTLRGLQKLRVDLTNTVSTVLEQEFEPAELLSKVYNLKDETDKIRYEYHKFIHESEYFKRDGSLRRDEALALRSEAIEAIHEFEDLWEEVFSLAKKLEKHPDSRILQRRLKHIYLAFNNKLHKLSEKLNEFKLQWE